MTPTRARHISLLFCAVIIILQYLSYIGLIGSGYNIPLPIHNNPIVTIIGSEGSLQRSSGRGLIITSGLIITARHVVDQTGYDYIVTWQKSDKTITKKIGPRRYHNDQDIALIGIDEGSTTRDTYLIQHILQHTGTIISSGLQVFTISPTGHLSTGTITETNINTIIQGITYTGLIQISLPVTPGWSGSPLWTSDGILIGIIVALDPRTSSHSLALPFSFPLE